MKVLLSFVILLSLFFRGHAQQVITDSVPNQVQVIQAPILSDTTTLSVMARLAKMSEEMNGMIQSLESHMNTSDVEENLSDIEIKLAYSDSYLGHYQHHYSYRVLRSHTVLLEQIRLKLHATGILLSKINSQFISAEKSIVAFAGDSSFRQVPQDTALRKVYLDQYLQMSDQWKHAAEINQRRMLQLAMLQDRLSENYLKWSSLHTHLKMRIESFSGNFLNNEEGPLLKTQSKQYDRGFPEVFMLSNQAAIAIFLYYARAHWLSMAIVILVCYLVSAWIIFLRKQFHKDINEYNTSHHVFLHYLSANPILTSLLLTFTFSPFFFASPPVIVVESIWTLNGLIVAILFYYDKRLPDPFKISWITFFLLFRIVGLLSLQLYNTLEERWILVVLNLAFIIVETYTWRISKIRKIFPSRLAGILFFFSLSLHVTSLAANFSGYFNLAKIVTNAATFSVFTAVLLKIFIDAMGEALAFQLAYLRRNFQDEKQFLDLYEAVSKIIKALAMISWLIFLLGSLNLLDKIKSELIAQLSSPFTIGNGSFTIGSIILFVFIIWVSATLSKLISLLTDITTKSGTKKYMNIRNSKLFLRLIIITAGVLLAFAATGIPIDRIAIILGALSVGIGFGLQNLVSNLVAGVMISIEHPVKVGDTIDIGMHTGVIREIGFRSIHILTPGGADVVVPNAELLSQHVVNWTRSNKHKRLEIVIPVNAKLDLHSAREAILELLLNHPRVMPTPLPEVVINNFLRGGGVIEMIEFTCYFWCENLANLSEVKSVVMEDIFHRLNAIEAKP